MTVDTACSSSLVALDVAVNLMNARKCESAIVGAANVILTPHTFVALCQARFLSPDGCCRVFDADANGYVRSEGVAVIITKPLGRAIQCGNPVRAVIRGTAVNHGGMTIGLTSPNPRAQEAVVCEAFSRAGIATSDAQVIECSATGTLTGDALEIEALCSARVIVPLTSEGAGQTPILLGSVKAHIGHLEACAGMAGLIKMVLSLENKTVPATLHVAKLNPKIPFDSIAARVVTKQTKWPASRAKGGELVAGVSSFGFGGTNAHVVLCDNQKATPPAQFESSSPEPKVHMLCLSAKSEGALRELARRYAARLRAAETADEVATVCAATTLCRAHLMPQRAAIVVAAGAGATEGVLQVMEAEEAAMWGRDELCAKLGELASAPPSANIASSGSRRLAASGDGVTFLFTG
jgi:acyl transferase domain-containing protein